MFGKIAIAAWIAGASAPPTQSASLVQGVVQDFESLKPIKGLTVTFASPSLSRSTTTDSEGRFHVELPAGLYQIEATSPFVVRPSGDSGGPRTVFVGVGSVTDELRLLRTQTGVISGRIVNSRGVPIPDALIQPLDLRYIEGEKFMTTALALGGTTDDRGEFRLHGVPPGQYFVRAEPRMPGGIFEGKSYFPGREINDAQVITVKSGEEAAHVDWVVASSILRRISGTMITPDAIDADGKFTKNFFLPMVGQLVPLDGRIPEMALIPVRGDETGRFELSVAPGVYQLHLARGVLSNFRPGRSSVDLGLSHSGKAIVDVTDGDVNGITIPLVQSTTIQGRVVVNRGEIIGTSPLSDIIRTGESKVDSDLLATYGTPRIQLGSTLFPGQFAAPIDSSGTFTIHGVVENRYSIWLTNLPDDAYVSRVEIGHESVPDLGLRVGKSDIGVVSITIDLNGSTVRGFVEDDVGQRIGGVPVVLVPKPEYRWNAALYRSVLSDAEGHFQFKGVAPGDYKVFSWRQVPRSKIGGAAEIGPEFVDPYEMQGTSLTVRPSSNPEAVRVVVIESR